MKYNFPLFFLLFCLSSSLIAQIPNNYSHSWSGINYSRNIAISTDDNKIYVRDEVNGTGDNVKIFSTSGSLLNSFSSIEGQGIAVDYYGSVYLGAYDLQTETASIKVYSGGIFIREWDLPLSYNPQDNYYQTITVRINRSSAPKIYVLCSDDWHNGTFFKFDRYGTLINSWEPTEMITSHSDMSIDTNNNLIYIVSYNWAKVYQYDENGNLLNSWGNTSACSTVDGEFCRPYGVANSIYGIISVADTDNDRVELFYSAGTFIEKITNYGPSSNNFVSPRSVVMSATGDWMYVLDNNGIHAFTSNPTSVNNEKSLIVTYSLSQNHPNPFNPTTTIKYSIKERSFVELKIYDLLGRDVYVLINEEQIAGSYEVKFDASNLPSGIYFYRIQAGSFVDTKKMIFLK